MDVLADLLAVSGVRGVLGARIEAGDRWGYWSPGATGAAFHAVTSGSAWLAARGEAPRELRPGDIVLLPRGTAHALGSDAATVARTGPATSSAWEQTGTAIVRIGSGEVRTHILCAHYEYDRAVSTQLFALLPDVVHIRAATAWPPGEGEGAGAAPLLAAASSPSPGAPSPSPGADELADTIRLLARELASPRLATAVVLDSLVDILLVQLLRVWLAERPETSEPSWLGALRDPVVSEAVAALHADPARPWTTAELAGELAVSRATLSRRFAAALGEPPAAYLTRWRMDLAARRLRDTDAPLEHVARAVGYTSVHAFNRAFRRAHAVPPGRFRALEGV